MQIFNYLVKDFYLHKPNVYLMYQKLDPVSRSSVEIQHAEQGKP